MCIRDRAYGGGGQLFQQPREGDEDEGHDDVEDDMEGGDPRPADLFIPEGEAPDALDGVDLSLIHI